MIQNNLQWPEHIHLNENAVLRFEVEGLTSDHCTIDELLFFSSTEHWIIQAEIHIKPKSLVVGQRQTWLQDFFSQ